MKGKRTVAIVLIIAGVLMLAYGGFTYTSQSHRVDIGPIELAVKEKNRVNIPIWAGVITLVLGGGILVFSKKEK